MEDTAALMNAAGNATKLQIRSAVRRKLRMVDNTNGFGAAHHSMLHTIDFDGVVGSIAATNTLAALAVTDAPLVATGSPFNNFLKQVNSRINSDPQ